MTISPTRALRHWMQILLCILSFAILAPSTAAQSIPPQVLQELQRRQQDAGVQDRVTSPVDRGRAQEEAQARNEMVQTSTPGGVALAAQQEREPTALEEDYRKRLGEVELEQYGYTLLTDRRVQGAGSAAGRIGDAYVVGVGDEFAVILQGNENQDYLTKVDSEGRLILRGLPPVSAAGRPLGDIRRDVEGRVSQAFIGTDVYLSLSALEQISVVVSGEVEAPGTYRLTAQDTVLDGLVRAAGVRRTGTLRNIAILRGERRIAVDLYRLFRGQVGGGVQLRDGDQLVVPALGDTYAVAGQVLRPGIYELPPGVTSLSAKTAISVAGGSLRPRGFELVLSRLDTSGNEIIDEITQNQSMISGDGLVVVRTSARSQGKVSISGHVAAPGLRALAATKNVAALLQRSGGYLDEPYLPFAVILREDPKTLSKSFKAVNLLADGGEAGLSMALQDADKLVVLSRKDIVFLSSDAVRQVVLTRRYDSDLSCRPLEKLARLTQDIQTERFSSVLMGAFVLEGEGTAQIADVAGGDDTEDVTAAGIASPRIDRMEIDDLEPEERKAFLEEQCPAIYAANDGLLSFALEHIAIASGSIRKPAVLPIATSVTLDTLIEFLGGLSFEASLTNVEISQPRSSVGEETYSRSQFDLTKTPAQSIALEAGSSIFFQSVPTNQEPGTILLSGEVLRPGIYTIRRGERLSSVIERAGGMTDRAYPFGSVFTRVSVKRAQDQAFKRTVREMNTALTTAALKGNVDSEALAAARGLTQSMRSVEALGRVVVEADPRVLSLRQDLDVILEPGDRLFIPKRPNHVLTMGDVLNPGALQFIRGKTVSQYLAETGGIQRSADEKRLFLVYPNGVARPLPRRFWGSSKEVLPPGSTIVVPKNTDPLASLQLTREVTSILSQLALSAASFAVIFDNN